MIRAIIDGKEVMGWYVCLDGYHYMVPFDASVLHSMRIDIATAARKTGKKDKHGKDIYGSDSDMQGGDRVHWCGNDYDILWKENRLTWKIGLDYLSAYQSSELEIIPKAGMLKSGQEVEPDGH